MTNGAVEHSRRRSPGLFEVLRTDWAANRGDARGQFVITAFRLTQAARGQGKRPRVLSVPLLVWYKLTVSWILGIDLPSSMRPPGPGLHLQHCIALLVHHNAIIGSNVAFKQSTTVGVVGTRRDPVGVPTIGDDVMLGSGCQVLGGVTIGDRAIIGAGAIVLQDVPADAIAVGNPARWYYRSDSQS